MTFNYDYYSRFEVPTLLLCHPDDTPIGMLTDVEDYKLELKFNEVSRLSFSVFQITNIEYIPAEVDASTVGKYFVFRENGEYDNYTKGYYEEIELDGHNNDLSLSYFTEEASYNAAFDNIMERREILVEDLGYFVITDVTDEKSEKGRFKSVSASSCDYELNYIEMPYLNGTYVLYSKDNWKEVDGETTLVEQDNEYYIDLYVTPFTIGTRYVRGDNDEYTPVTLPEEYSPKVTYYGINDYVGKDCLLYEIMKSIPHWTLKQTRTGNNIANKTNPDYVELAQKYRTFSPDDKMTVYAFLKTKLQESFECFVKFDILNRVIEICRYEDALTDMNFILNEKNFVDECKIKTTIDDYTNALSVTASDDDLYMSSVNPLGTSTIYNFKHDIDSGFIVSEYEEVDEPIAVKGWYFYIDDGKYVPVYIDPNEGYDNTKQYYQPTEAGTLAAALTIWQKKYDEASITYHGINYDNWDAWVKEINRIKNWVTGDYYYAGGATGTDPDKAMLVVKNVVKIAGSIQTQREFPVKWKPSYGQKYTLSPAPLAKEDIIKVVIKGDETTPDRQLTVAAYNDDVDSDSFGEVTLANDYMVPSDATVTFTYKYVPAIAPSSVDYYYNYYARKDITSANFEANKSGLYKRGKYGFESCASSSFNSNELYFSLANTGAATNIDGTADAESLIGRFIVKNDFIPVTPQDGDGIDTYYVWNGAKFIEAATEVDENNHKQGLANTQYFIKEYKSDLPASQDDHSLNANIEDVMAWINSNRGDLGSGEYQIVTDEPGESSYAIVDSRSAYDSIDQEDTYGKMYFSSVSDNDLGDNVSQETLDAIAAGMSTQDMYVFYDFDEITYATEDGVPGVVEARLVQTKVDLAIEDVISEVVGLVSTISGYTAQIKALQDVNPTQVSDDKDVAKQTIQNEINQIYGFVADARAGLIVALDKYRMLLADRNLLSEQINNLATGLSFETFFANYFIDNGIAADAAGQKAKNLYAKLIRFLRQQSYNEENITIEDNMTSDQKQQQELELYKYAVELLGKLIEPTYTIDIDIEAFPFIEDYMDIANGLDVGSVINIELQTGEVERFNLIGVTIDYDNKDISLKFGNHLNDNDAASVFEDLQTSAASASAIVASNYVNWGAAVDETTQLMKERNNILDATLHGITARNSSLKDNITIDTSGIKCMTQRVNTDGDLVDTYGLWISNGVIMFTDDGWKSSKMAVGRMVDNNGNTLYGFNGDTILANTIAADKLVAGTLSSGNNMIKDGSFESYVNDNVYGTAADSKLYKFTVNDPWSVINDYGYQTADYDYTGVVTVSSESDACLGERYLHVYREGAGGGITYTEEITVLKDGTHTISFYCKPDDTPTDGSVQIDIYKPGEGTFLSAVAPFDELSDDWSRFSATGELPAGVYHVSITSTMDVNYMIDGVLLEQSVMLNGYSDMPGENFAKYTVMDENGLRIYGGRISAYNKAGEEVIRADSNTGNLYLTGVLTARSGSNIAGWITKDYGFYKQQWRHIDETTNTKSGEYPQSGLFIQDAKYGFEQEGGKYYFKFIDDTYQGNKKDFPLLFTGYNGSAGGNTEAAAEISSNTCNFIVDNRGYLKAVNATITGTNTEAIQASHTGYSSGKTTYGTNANQNLKNLGDIMVVLDGFVIPKGSGYANGFVYNSDAGTIIINGDTRGKEISVYSESKYAASISYATITQVKLYNASMKSSFIEKSYLSDSDIIQATITNSDITDCKIHDHLYIYSGNTQVATITATSKAGDGSTTSDTNLLIDAKSGNNGNGSITIRAKSTNTSRKANTSGNLEVESNATSTSSVITSAMTSAFKTIGIGSLAWSIKGLKQYTPPNASTIVKNKPILLDGDVYITGLQSMYGPNADIVYVVSDINNKINTIQTQLSLLSAFAISTAVGLTGAVGGIAAYIVGNAILKAALLAISPFAGPFGPVLLGWASLM